MPDPFTHASIAYLFARHRYRAHKGWFVVAGLAPDIDVAVAGAFVLLTAPLPDSIVEFGRQSLVFHPGLSGAVWFLPLYALALAGVIAWLGHNDSAGSFGFLFKLVLTGMLLHIGLDLLQTGNRPFWPLEWTAGVDLLPYSAAGRLITMAIAVGLLAIDTLVSALWQKR